MTQCVCIHRWEKPNEFIPSNELVGKTVTQIRNYLKLKDEKLLISTPLFRKPLEPDTVPLTEYKELIYTEGKTLNKYPPTNFNLTILPNIISNTNSLTFSIKTQLTETTFPNMTVDYNPDKCKTVSDLTDIVKKLFNIGCEEEEIIKTENECETILSSDYTVSEMLDLAINQIKSNQINNLFTFSCKIPDDTIKSISKRCCLSSEVISSEESFVADLFQLHQVYEKEIKKSKIFDDIQFKFIFNELPGIVNTHKKLLGDLKQVHVSYASEFGPIFLNFVDNFKVSLSFVSKFKKVDEMIKTKLLRPDAEAKFKEIEDANESGKTFMSYYITPVQRYPRYPLLIRDLIKYTPDFHPDKPYLTKALLEIDTANKRLDEASHKIKQLVEIEDIEKVTNHCIAEEGREFIMQKTVKISKPKSQTGVLYLFNDIVFLAIKTKRGQQIIFGNDIEFINVGNFQFCNDRPTSDSIIANIFQKEYTITFESYSEKAVWMDSFNKVRVNQLSIISETKKFAKWTDIEMGEQIYPLTGHDGVMFKNKAYFVGGLNQSNSNNQNMIIYDIENDKWSAEPVNGLPARSFHACGTYNDYIYAFFGQGSKNVVGDIWRSQGGEWTKVPAPTSNQRYGHSVVLYNDLFYIFGGRNGEKTSNDVLIFNPEKNNFTTVEPSKGSKVPSGRYYHSASIYNDEMIIFGGKTSKGVSSDMYSFNFAKSEWKRLDISGLKPRYGHKSIVLSNDYLFIIGGFHKNGVSASTIVISLEKMQLLSDFAEFGNVPFSVAKYAIVPLTENRALIYGGVDASAKVPFCSSYIIDTEEGFDSNRQCVRTKKEPEKRREVSLNIPRARTSSNINTPSESSDEKSVLAQPRHDPKIVEKKKRESENSRNTIGATDDFMNEIFKRTKALERKQLKDQEDANSSPDLTNLISKSQSKITIPSVPLPPSTRKLSLLPNTYDDTELSDIKKKHMDTSQENGRKRANTINTSSFTVDDKNSKYNKTDENENEDDKSDQNEISEKNEKITETEEKEEADKTIETEEPEELQKIVETEKSDNSDDLKETEEEQEEKTQETKESENPQETESPSSNKIEKTEEIDNLKEASKSSSSTPKKRNSAFSSQQRTPAQSVSSNLDKSSPSIKNVNVLRAQSTILNHSIDVNKEQSNFEPDPNLKLSSTFNENEFCRKFCIDVSQLSPIHHQQMVMKMKNAYKLIIENEGYENQVKLLNQKGSLVLKVSDESKHTHILFFSADDTFDEILQKANQAIGKEIAASQFSIQLPNEEKTEFSEESFQEKKEKLINENLPYLKVSEN